MEISVRGSTFRIVKSDNPTLGVVKDTTGRVICGWSQDPSSENVHVLGVYGGEWRGLGLEHTVKFALEDMR